MIRAARALVHVWLVLDFFGDSRRSGKPGSSLTTTIFWQSFLGLLLAALLLDPRHGLVAFAAANLSLSTLLLGIGSLGDADLRSRDRRQTDRFVTATAPIPRRAVALARAFHGGFHLGTVTIGVALPPAILCLWVGDRTWWSAPVYLVLAVVLASIASAAMGLVVRIADLWRGPAGAALFAGTVRAILLGGGLIGFALGLSHLDEDAMALPGGPWTAWCWPPYWAARWLTRPVDDAWFGAAIVASSVVLAVVHGVLPPSGSRPASRELAPRWGPLSALEQHFAPRGALRGITVFTSTMMLRAPGFRARVLPLIGVPAAMVLLQLLGNRNRDPAPLLGVAMQLPAIYLPFLVAFLPQGEGDAAAWPFDVTPGSSLRMAREAATIALSVRVVLPVTALAALAAMIGGVPVPLVLGLAGFSGAIAVFAAALATRRLETMPFTSSEAAVGGLEFGGLLAPAMILSAAGAGFGKIAGTWPGWLVSLGLIAAAWRFLATARVRGRETVTP